MQSSKAEAGCPSVKFVIVQTEAVNVIQELLTEVFMYMPRNQTVF